MVYLMIIKQVKEYGSKTKRQRIDLNKSDNIPTGSDVVIIPKDKYDEIKQEILDLQQQITDKDSELKIAYAQIDIAGEVADKYEEQIQDLKNKEINLKEIIKDAITPIDNPYQKEIENKVKELKQLQIKYDSLQAKAHKNNLELMGLNAYQILIQRKLKKLVLEFDQELTIIRSDPENVVDADAKIKLPGNDTK